jgi:deferrochelatase/peroxidase EfeB
VNTESQDPISNFDSSFGFNDGISQPFIEGFGDTVLPGQEEIRPGIVLTGHDGDTVTRPTWAVDGSFMVFRKLTQLVPEFDAFLTANALAPGGPAGAELLGARLVGRWKSGWSYCIRFWARLTLYRCTN